MDRHDAVLLPFLVDRRGGQARIGTPLGQPRTTTGSGGLRRDNFAERRRDHRRVGRGFVAGHQRGRLLTEAVLDLGGDLLDALGDRRFGHQMRW
ncbi:MAG: hypothetical protein JO034_25845 [Singulisphaera sp.]|nr:hypothetical protein [Singulisphaera sp.]